MLKHSIKNDKVKKGLTLHSSVVLSIVTVTFITILFLPIITQDQDYHRFSDSRSWFGITNTLDVVSNIAFLIAGMYVFRNAATGTMTIAWRVFAIGVIWVSMGSAYYHLNPNDDSLVWDRLPMTVGFMAMFSALLEEHFNIGRPRGLQLLLASIVVGCLSIIWWKQVGDLRFYAWVQFMPMLVLLYLLVCHPPNYSHRLLLTLALCLYFLAKLFEHFDEPIFLFTAQLISGHTLKHFFAALSCGCIGLYLRHRSQRLDIAT